MDFVIERASSGLKNGLFVIDKDLASVESIRHLLAVKGKGQDYVIHRSKLGFLKPELEYIRNSLIEANKAIANNQTYKPDKRIVLRIHDNREFSFSKESLIELFKDYGQDHGFNIYLAYYLAAIRTRTIEKYVMAECAENEQSFKDFVNPDEWAKKTDNFVYYDWFSKKILGVDQKLIDQATNSIAEMFKNQA